MHAFLVSICVWIKITTALMCCILLLQMCKVLLLQYLIYLWE